MEYSPKKTPNKRPELDKKEVSKLIWNDDLHLETSPKEDATDKDLYKGASRTSVRKLQGDWY